MHRSGYDDDLNRNISPMLDNSFQKPKRASGERGWSGVFIIIKSFIL